MIHLQMNGFIADNLFQYTAARIVAEELGYALQVSHSRMHPQQNVPRLLALMSRFADAPLALEGKSFAQPVDHTACAGHGNFDGYRLDLPAMLHRRDDRRIEMAGYFQHYELIRPYKSDIRSWFQVAPNSLGHAVSANDVVIHIRLGDLVVFGWAISPSFYSQLLDTLDFGQLYICGFGLGEEVRQHFARFDPIYVHGEPADDFLFMKSFNRMILSNSGFAWWAAFLSQAQEIYAPVMAANTRTFDPKAALADLRVYDEPRYHYIQDVPYLERAFTLRDIFESRGQLRKKRVLNSLRQLLADRLRGRPSV
jgi:hypothetical protein